MLSIRPSLMILLIALPALTQGAGSSPPTLALEIEAGPVWQTVNDQQIPNTADGTRFSLPDLVGKGPQTAVRAYLTWHINGKHALRGLFAPLSFTETGVPGESLRFNGDVFAAGAATDATYKFDSYRLTYSYLWREGETWTWRIGFTAKIRDARVRLSQGALISTKDNVGFVPLLHLAGHARLSDRWSLNLDLDALAGGPGRAEDVAIKLGYALTPGWALRIGYRTVEGGADVEEVYSFAWLHYAVGSMVVDF